VRIEGYLPPDDFHAKLHAALARVAFMQKHWADAERIYRQIVERFPNTLTAAEALYWAGVSHYKGTNDHTGLPHLAVELQNRYPNSQWAKSASVWAA
jgi:TolA-binding protein